MNTRAHIVQELEKLAPGLAHLPVAMPYTIPEGYFEELSDNLLVASRNNELPAVFQNISRQMPYQAPDAYFDNLAPQILDKLHHTTHINKVPEGYFDSLPDILIHKVRRIEVAEELESIAPLLNTISKQPVQFVPEDYFENLRPTLVENKTSQTPVISILKKENQLAEICCSSQHCFVIKFWCLHVF